MCLYEPPSPSSINAENQIEENDNNNKYTARTKSISTKTKLT